MKLSVAARLAAGILLIASLAAQDHVHTSRPGARVLPLPKEKDVWHFVVYGDRTGGPAEGIEVLRQAVVDTNLLDPDLVMTVGDLVQGYNETPEWDAQAREFSGVMAGLTMPWYPVAGNHDVYWRGKAGGEPRPVGEHETNYERHFGPLWYWFPHKSAAFIILYTDEGNPENDRRDFSSQAGTTMSQRQIAWLRETVGKTRAYREVFVFLHHPRWLKHQYENSNWEEVHAVLAEAGNVRAVFAGHIHQMDYAGVRDGIEYFALATTGGGFSHRVPRAGWLHHLDVVTVRQDRLSVATIPIGAVIDPREVTTERAMDARALMNDLHPAWSGPLILNDDAGAAGSVEITVRNPARRPIEVELEPRSADGRWTFVPDHAHARIEAGGALRIPLRYRRTPGDLERRFVVPELSVRVDYLAETVRIALPERTFAAEVFLGETPSAGTVADGCLDLDGKRGCVRVPSAQVALGDGPFTVEGWVRARQLDGRRPFLAKTELSEYALFVSGGRPDFSVHVAGRYVRARAPKAVLETGRWHHLAGVWDGEEARLYVDGRLQGKGRLGTEARRMATDPAPRTRNRFPLYLGADPNDRGSPVDHLDGSIDEVRVSSTARYRGASFHPRRRHRVDAATVLLLHCDRAAGPFLVDAAGVGTGAAFRGGSEIVLREP